MSNNFAVDFSNRPIRHAESSENDVWRYLLGAVFSAILRKAGPKSPTFNDMLWTCSSSWWLGGITIRTLHQEVADSIAGRVAIERLLPDWVTAC